MLWADVSFTTEGLAVITAVMTVLAGVVAYLFKLLFVTLTARLGELTSQRDRWREIALEAIDALEAVGQRVRIVNPPEATAAKAGQVIVSGGPVPKVEEGTAEFRIARDRLSRAKNEHYTDPPPPPAGPNP